MWHHVFIALCINLIRGKYETDQMSCRCLRCTPMEPGPNKSLHVDDTCDFVVNEFRARKLHVLDVKTIAQGLVAWVASIDSAHVSHMHPPWDVQCHRCPSRASRQCDFNFSWYLSRNKLRQFYSGQLGPLWPPSGHLLCRKPADVIRNGSACSGSGCPGANIDQ